MCQCVRECVGKVQEHKPKRERERLRERRERK